MSINLFAFTSITNIKFESGIALYGKVGISTITLKENFDTNRYEITMISTSTGVVKSLTSNRVDTLKSIGIMKNGIYIPQTYIKKIKQDGMDKTTTYQFDYKNNIVIKETLKHKDMTETHFDHTLFKIVSKDIVKTTKKTKKIKLFPNDFLTLFLNLRHHELKKGEINYVDQKKKDALILVNANNFNISKGNGETIYKIFLIDDDDSIFFEKAISKVPFLGEAYIKKISESSKKI